MIEIIFFALLAGSVLAGILDLLTTEVPDEILVLMVVSGIFYWFIYSLSTENMAPLFISLLVGTVSLAIGWTLYKKGQWGGADAMILASIGYSLPHLLMDFVVNLLLVGSAYMVIYAIILGIKNREVFGIFLNDLKENKKAVIGLPAAFLLSVAALSYVSYVVLGYAQTGLVLNLFLLIVFLTLFWRYGRVIEKNVFRKKIPVSKLKEGDVVEDMIWRGLTRKEIMKIRRQRKFVVVKDGVRFVPAFPMALVATVLWGNLLLLII